MQAIHEFKGGDTLALSNGGLDATFGLPRVDTYGRATSGVASTVSGPRSAFAEVSADFGGGVNGHLGFAVRF